MFKFTIRETILVTTIVAAFLTWWLERSQNTQYKARLTAIEARLRIKNAKGISATVQASTDTPYAQLNDVLQALRRAGVDNISVDAIASESDGKMAQSRVRKESTTGN